MKLLKNRLTLAALFTVVPYFGAQAEPSSYVFAVTWHSGFCEARPDLQECMSQDAPGYPGDRFVLHGLWPQPYGSFYCDVDHQTQRNDLAGSWGKLDPVDLPSDLSERLSAAMPGVASFLDRHEWIRHGTCHEAPDPVSYFEDSLRLLEELNQSAVGELFASEVGDHVSLHEIRAAFDESFGEGAGQRVALECDTVGERGLIVELRISLTSPIADNSLRQLLDRAAHRHGACDGGIVDAPGRG